GTCPCPRVTCARSGTRPASSARGRLYLADVLRIAVVEILVRVGHLLVVDEGLGIHSDHEEALGHRVVARAGLGVETPARPLGDLRLLEQAVTGQVVPARLARLAD